MGMQTDVKAAHLNLTGQAYIGRTRLKGAYVVNGTTAGIINFWDSTTATKAGTYARANTTVTVTITAHNLAVNDQFGFSATDGSATAGNYTVASVANANAFTFTEINTGTSTGNCTINTRWLMNFDTANNLATSYILIPGEGIVANNGILVGMLNQESVVVFYG
jgi:hypothetical protein